MNIYNYSKRTNEFIGQAVAKPDPLEDENFLIPASATNIAPPSTTADQVAVFNGTSWDIKTDERGTYWLPDGSEVVIENIGDNKPVNSLDTPPPPSLDNNRVTKISEIRSEAINRISSVIPALDNIETIALLAEIWPGLDAASLGSNMVLVKDIYVYAKTKITQVQSATQAQLDGYDPVTDPNWPT